VKLLFSGIQGRIVLMNRVLRKICGLRREEVTGDWRKLHEELYDLYSSPDNAGVIKSWMMR
jgi:PAS domain-containing protein